MRIARSMSQNRREIRMVESEMPEYAQPQEEIKRSIASVIMKRNQGMQGHNILHRSAFTRNRKGKQVKTSLGFREK